MEFSESDNGLAGRPVVDINWDAAREFLGKIVRRRLDRLDADSQEDLIQEAMIRLLRAVRKETPKNMDAFMTTIAQRTNVDFIRRRGRWSLLVDSMTDAVEYSAATDQAPPDQFGDPKDRFRFAVLEFFGQSEGPCRELAEFYFEEVDWKAVAGRLGKSYAAVRRQWSRCVEKLRGELGAPGPKGLLEDWGHVD